MPRSLSTVLARPSLAALALAVPLLLSPLQLHGESFVWVDENGVTHLTDDPAAVPEHLRGESARDVDRLRGLWNDGLQGPVAETPPGSSSSPEDRVQRLLIGAVSDLERGETARALAAFRSVVRLDPGRPEPYWYLAQVDRQRGRYARAAENLESFLSTAGPGMERWRVAAQRRLAELRDERRLADQSIARGPLQLVDLDSPHFRIQLDSELSSVSGSYAKTALGYLDDARAQVADQIGVEPLEPLGVVFYGRAAYSTAHSHRFSFQTVGFFDGRIHVASPAHPTPELRSLLFHEYAHAVFRDQTGGDRPYWLNEGLAEKIERGSKKIVASTRSERASLRSRIVAGSWIPLRRMAPSFSGLSNEEARAAYLQSSGGGRVDRRADRSPKQRARLLRRLGEGMSTDQALHEVLGLDTEGLDAAVRGTDPLSSSRTS